MPGVAGTLSGFTVTATFTLKDSVNYTFAEDATVDTLTVTVEIAPQEKALDPTAKLPVFSGGESNYDGVRTECVADGYDPEYLKVDYKYFLNGQRR